VLFTQAQPISLSALVLVLAAAAYLGGVYRLGRTGTRWAPQRTAFFLAGLAAIGAVTVGGLAAYDDVLLSAHMVQHMVLAMVAPFLLALGAPVTLALRTLPRGGRRPVLVVLHSRIARFLTFPVVAFAIMVASPFALYFTGLYRLSLENDWVHALVHLHFLISGSLFVWPLIGLDPVPARVPYPLRALVMFLSTVFHTVLGLTVMDSANLIAGDWYPSLRLGWADPASDQRLAGGILWAGGELVSVIMLGALVAQWMRHADREARRIDRELDRREEREREREERERDEREREPQAAVTAAVSAAGSARYDQQAPGPATLETPP
jgi:putative copper resistance protein D